MDKEMLDILKDLSKKPTTELALQIMELSSENLILEQQCKKQKEVIDKAIEKLYCWGKTLDPAFQKDLLDILKGEQNG